MTGLSLGPVTIAAVPAKPAFYPLWLLRALFVALPAGAVLLALAIARVGPDWFDLAGATLIGTGYTVALAVRTGGRPLVFGGMALVFSLAAAFLGWDGLRTGAAVMTAACTAVLAVMITVPAVRFRAAVVEVLVALGVSVLGAVAVVGFRPDVVLDRFDYAVLALGLLLGFGLVFRLGAGWHGLGRRGLFVVLGGTVALAVTVAYAEMLRRYGSEDLLTRVFDTVRWMRDTLGAAPRPLQVAIGWPALLWGCHMRARRRQGWWVCVFGVAATASVAGTLVNPATGWLEAGLITLYSLVPGVLLGYALIRLDLLLTGPRGSRARRAEEESAGRPEPARLQPLL